METVELKFTRTQKKFGDIPLPQYATEGSAGMDVRAAIEKETVLEAGKVIIVPTGLRAEIPEGYEIQVRPRSGLAAKHGIGVLNSPGTIDSDYRGEIKIILFNFSNEPFIIKRGERIAQLILAKTYRAEIKEVETLSETKRGEGGFGHTGKK